MQDCLDRFRVEFELQLIFPANDFGVRDAIGFIIEQDEFVVVSKQHVDNALNEDALMSRAEN